MTQNVGRSTPPDVAHRGAAALVEVRRSAKRRRTVTAYREGERIVVLMPARFSSAEERRWVDDMVARLSRRERRQLSGSRRSDAALAERAAELSREYLDGRAVPASIRWVDNMTTRWGSCTTVDRTIRISSRLRRMPGWVVDYVIVHELTHLLVADHDADFWALVARYRRTERARGFLEGAVFDRAAFDGAEVDGAEVDGADEPAGRSTPRELLGADCARPAAGPSAVPGQSLW